jgi:phosphoglycerate dehydrogenase-like enzyme
MLLACARRLFEGDREVRAGVWNPLYLMSVGRLRGQVLGRVGFGKIGQAVARRATAFGITHTSYDPSGQDARTAD